MWETVIQYGCRRCQGLHEGARKEVADEGWAQEYVRQMEAAERNGTSATAWHSCPNGGMGLLRIAGFVVRPRG